MKKIFVLIVIIIILFSYTLLIEKNNHIEFNVNDWNSLCEERYKMLSSLTEQYKLIGMNRDEILELLGTNGIYTNNNEVLEYYVAKGVGDPLFFGIYFNEQGCAVEYKSFEN